MRSVLVFFVIAANLSGCVTAPPPTIAWSKPGGNYEGFMRDRYDCLQAGRQTISGAYVNQYGGAASSNVAVDRGMFMGCMGARGYQPDISGNYGFTPPPGSVVYLIN